MSRRKFLGAALGTAAVTGLAVASPIVRSAVDSGIPGGSGISTVPPFDADRAYAYLLKQVEFGPREPGKRGHIECRDYLQGELRKSLSASRLQPFEMQLGDNAISMWNILGEHDPTNARQVLLCAHWDTRPTADEEPEPEDRDQPIAGANDGASGVAVLLEIASVLRDHPPSHGVRFVLFDGEDYGPGSDRMYLGAKHYAQHLPKPDPAWGVLLDMVGDRDLDIWRERNSENYAPEVNDRIWRAAEAAGHSDVFHDSEKWSIMDDHVPLLEAGVPVVDLIDFDYPHWHTLEDTPDKCSPQSLAAVGETVLHALYT